MRVLVVEDEPRMAGLLRRAFVEEGYAVDVAYTGEDGYQHARTVGYDTIVLDILLPGGSGFGVCTRLRRDGVWTPILMLTARDAVADRVHGLDSGADDYLTKPFSLPELLARVRALTRRGAVERPTVLTAGDLSLDPATRQVRRAGTEITLTAKELRAHPVRDGVAGHRGRPDALHPHHRRHHLQGRRRPLRARNLPRPVAPGH